MYKWMPQVQKHFDEGIFPEVTDLWISHEGKHVAILLFETDRAPFVVKNPKGVFPDRFVPWRKATSFSIAHRRDLLRILMPKMLTPRIEGVSGTIKFKRNPSPV